MGDTLSDFGSTKFAQNLPEKHAFAASMSNADPEGGFPRATDLMLSMLLSNEVLVSKIFDAARAAMDELFLKATKGEPLWITNGDGTEKFNEKEYQIEFQLGDMSFENKSLGANVEVTREFGCVPMLREDIVNMLMDCVSNDSRRKLIHQYMKHILILQITYVYIFVLSGFMGC